MTETSPLSDNIENIDLETLRVRIRNLCKRISCYWKKTNRTKSILIEKYADWLSEVEYIDVTQSIEQRISQQNDNVEPSPSSSRGRPRKNFNESSKRTKRRRLAELSNLDKSAVNTLLNASASANDSLTSTKVDENKVLSLIGGSWC